MPAIRFVLLFSLSCWIGTLTAQPKKGYTIPPGTWLLRINPMGLIDPIETNLSLGTEYRFHESWATSADVAYVFQSYNVRNAKHAKGFIVRPAIRKYFDRGLNTYVEAELHYKMVSSTVEDWVGRKTVNGVAAYQEYKRFHARKNVGGLHLKLGVQESLNRSHRLWLEVYAGIGVRHRWLTNDLPSDATYQFMRSMFATNLNEERSTVPAFVGGFRLMYKIN